MRGELYLVVGLLLWTSCARGGNAAVSPVVKTNPARLYAHYMPWFEAEDGDWGIHWTMATRDPEVVDAGDKRQIAAHYYPLIGPYDSADRDVIEYHLLLMKLSGIDGVLIDWYGAHEVRDYGGNRRNAEALIARLDEVGLDFAMVYEDFTAEYAADTALVAAQADLRYARDHYFAHERYVRVGGAPLLLVFGPRLFETPAAWGHILSGIEPRPHLLTLWHQSADAGAWAAGEFAWVDRGHIDDLDSYYAGQGAFGAAYPGFRDYYREGGWGDGLGWTIAHDEDATLAATLARARRAEVPFVQLVTWNDFGEGTMIEPTREFGFSLLEQVQAFAGVEHGVADLELVHALYLARKRHAGDADAQAALDRVFRLVAGLALAEAAAVLKELD